MQLKSLAAVGRRRRLESRLSIGLTARCGPICTDNFARGRQLTVLNCPSSSTTLKAQRSSSHCETAQGVDPSEGATGKGFSSFFKSTEGELSSDSHGCEPENIQRKPTPRPHERHSDTSRSVSQLILSAHPKTISSRNTKTRGKDHCRDLIDMWR